MSQQDADSSAGPSSAKPSDEAQAGQSEDTQLEIQPTRPGDRGIPRVAISTRTMWRAVGVVLITLTAI